jgi:hypothetical protein
VTAQRNGVADDVAAQLFGRKVVAHRLRRRRRGRQVGEHHAAVRDRDLKLVAVEEKPAFIPTI